MTKEQFIEKIVDLLDIETEIKVDTKLTDIEEWDSLSFVSFLSMANVEGRKLNPDDVRQATTLHDLYILING